MNKLIDFVKENLPDYGTRYQKWEEDMIEENGIAWVGKSGNQALVLRFANLHFDEALKVYTDKITNK